MYNHFNKKYIIFFNEDFSGDVKWANFDQPNEERIIPADVVKLLKDSICANLLDTLYDKIKDIMWEVL